MLLSKINFEGCQKHGIMQQKFTNMNSKSQSVNKQGHGMSDGEVDRRSL